VAVFVVFVVVGGSLGSLSPPSEEAAADDDEVALEDYVDNELPNFSGDVQSSVFGDGGGGYDVHIEVKIANRTKGGSGAGAGATNGVTPPLNLASGANHDKAKKILDLIIEKLKRKKDARGSVSDDDTDIEISEKDDYAAGNNDAQKPKVSKVTESEKPSEKTENVYTAGSSVSSLFNDDGYVPITPAGDFADAESHKPKQLEAAEKPQKSTQKQHSAFSLPEPSKEEEEFSFKAMSSSRKASHHNPPEMDAPTSSAPKMMETSTAKSVEGGIETGEGDAVVSKTNKLKLKKSGKPESPKAEPEIKISDDGELRIKIPDQMNKSSLVSQIMNLVKGDSSKSQESSHNSAIADTVDAADGARQALMVMGTKLLTNQNDQKKLYKQWLKTHGASEEKDSAAEVQPSVAPDAPITNDEPVSDDRTALNLQAKESVTIPAEAVEGKMDQTSPIKDVGEQKKTKKKMVKMADSVADMPPAKGHHKESEEETGEKNHEEASVKNPHSKGIHLEDSAKSHHSKDLEDMVPAKNHQLKYLDDLPAMKNQAVKNLDVDMPTGRFQQSKDSKEEGVEKIAGFKTSQSQRQQQEPSHDGANSEFHDVPKNDAFIPNHVASKSFQENLEPEDATEYKTLNEPFTGSPTEKKDLNIVPLDLRIDDVEPQISSMISTPKTAVELRAPTKKQQKKAESFAVTTAKQQRKPESFVNSGVPTQQKYVQMNIVTVDSNHNKHGKHGGTDHETSTASKINPAKLFNDSLFQQAGEDSSDEAEEPKQKKEKTQSPSTSFNGNVDREMKLASTSSIGKKPVRVAEAQPIIDLLTFPTASELTETILENKKTPLEMEINRQYNKQQQRFHNNDNNNNVNNNNNNNNSNNIKNKKHESPRESTRTKAQPIAEITRQQHASNFREAPKATPVLKQKVRAVNSPLLSPKQKKGKNFGLELKDTKDAAAKDVSTKKSLDLSDLGLDSLQVSSKDNLEIGGRTKDDEDGGAAEEESLEDGSAGADDEEADPAVDVPASPEESNSLTNANLAIWRASEDIHALLHSLTDREHADRVLGNLKNFITDKHTVSSHKRNLQHKGGMKKGDRKNSVAKRKTYVKSRYPEHLLVKRRSGIPVKHRRHHRRRRHIGEVHHSKGASIKGLKTRGVENFTALNNEGVDRLYNQLATSSSRIAPTFEDDSDGWSEAEVKNVMKQLKSPDIEEDMLSMSSGQKTAGYDGSENRRHIGSPVMAPVSENDVRGVEAASRHHHEKDVSEKSSVFSDTYLNNNVNDVNLRQVGDKLTQSVRKSTLKSTDANFKNGDFSGSQAPNYENSFFITTQLEDKQLRLSDVMKN